jgi:predicted Zn-dependent protease
MPAHHFITLLTILISITTMSFSSGSLANSIILPDIGDNAGNVSPAEEYRTGEAVIRNIRHAGGIIDDALIQEYLDELGYRIVATSEAQQSFHFFLINDSAINAFALPGGFIGINAGLVLATKSESELAGVMAHEIAHVTQRHHARQYEQGSNSLPIFAALIAAIILGKQDSNIGNAAFASVLGGTTQKQINFTRENEKEADRIGIELLIHAEFNPHGMPEFFETLDKQSRLYGDSLPEFLRSHPVTPSRIADSKHRASQYPNALTIDSTNYQLLRTRIKVLESENKTALLEKYTRMMQQGSYQNENATRYGLALSLLSNKNYTEALKQAQILLTKTPGNITYNILKAQIETESLNYSAAINTFQNILKIYPGNKTINLFYAQTLIKANMLKLAQQVLQTQISESIKTPEVYRLLAETQAKLNDPVSSHQSLAEYYYLLGQTHDAIKQLEIALKIPKINFYSISRLEARLQEFKNELLQLSTN